MAKSKAAFDEIRAAISTVHESKLKLQELWELQHSTLGRDSEFSRVKADLKAAIKELPRGHKDKLKFQAMLKDLNSLAGELRDAVRTAQNAIRMEKAAARDERYLARKENAVKRIIKDFKFLLDVNPLTASSVLDSLNEMVMSTNEQEIVESK